MKGGHWMFSLSTTALITTLCMSTGWVSSAVLFDSASGVSPSPMIHVQNSSAEAATLEEQAMANAALALSNTSLADLQNDSDTQRLQIRFRERKRQERLLTIQTQILRRLGISRQPNSSLPAVISEEERRKIIDIIERVQSTPGQGNSPPIQLHAERVQSFYPTCGAVPANTDNSLWQDDSSFRLYYDIDFPRPSGNTEISIVSAKLRLYKTRDPSVTPCPECETPSNSLSPQGNFLDNLYRCASRGISVSVYQYTKPLRAYRKEKKRLVDSRTISVDSLGWVDFNIISTVTQWFQQPSKNYGLEIEVEDAFGTKKSTSNYFQKMNCTEGVVVQDPPFPNILNMHPDMAENESALFDNETYPTLDLQTIELSRDEGDHPSAANGQANAEDVSNQDNVATTERHVVRKRHAKDGAHTLKSYNDWRDADNDTNSVNHFSTMRMRRRSCKPKEMYISFKELDLDDTIIAPEGYSTLICPKHCGHYRRRPRTSHLSQHAETGPLYFKNRWSVTCTPSKFASLAVLVMYPMDESLRAEVKLRTFNNLAVSSCSCKSTAS